MSETSFTFRFPKLFFPFKNYQFDFGSFKILLKDCLVFEKVAVIEDGSVIDLNNRYGFDSSKPILEHLAQSWGEGSRGLVIRLDLPGLSLRTDCHQKSRSIPPKHQRYTSYRNGIKFGEFEIGNKVTDPIIGSYLNAYQNESWFIGMSLIKIVEAEIEMD